MRRDLTQSPCVKECVTKELNTKIVCIISLKSWLELILHCYPTQALPHEAGEIFHLHFGGMPGSVEKLEQPDISKRAVGSFRYGDY